MRIIIVLLCLLFASLSFAGKRSDSLLVAVSKPNMKYSDADTLATDLLNGFSKKYRRNGSLDTAYLFANKALDISTLLAKSNNKQVSMAAKKQMAYAYNNLGNIAEERGQISEALNHFFTSLRIKEELKDENGVAVTIHNIGSIYSNNGNQTEALKNFSKAAEINKRIHNYMNLCKNYHNIAGVYIEWKDFKKALEYYDMSLKIKRDINDENGIATTLNNIGTVKAQLGEKEEARKLYFEALAIAKKNKFKSGILLCYGNISDMLIKEGKIKEADEMINEALPIATEMQSADLLMTFHLQKSKTDSALGNFRSAYSHYKAYYQIVKQLRSEEASKKLIQMQLQYDYDKKEQQQKAEQEKKDAIAAEKIRAQQMRSNFLIGGLLLMGIAIVFIYRSYIGKKRINAELNTKNIIIEQKQKEIIDSIRYAQRIQKAQLPSENIIRRTLKDLRR